MAIMGTSILDDGMSFGDRVDRFFSKLSASTAGVGSVCVEADSIGADSNAASADWDGGSISLGVHGGLGRSPTVWHDTEIISVALVSVELSII